MCIIQRNRFNTYYTKYVVKSPLVFGGFIIIGLILFFSLTLTNKAKIMKTYDGKFCISNGKYTIDFAVETPQSTSGFIYRDRNEAMYPVNFESISSNQLEVISDKTLPFDDGVEIKVDVVEQEVTLLYLIFVKGGGT